MNASPEKALHVLHVAEAAGGGVRRHLGLIVPALHAAGVRQTVVVSLRRAEPGMPGDLAAWSALGCSVHVLPMRHGLSLYDPAHVLSLRRLVRCERPTAVHAHATKAGLLARLAAPQGVPVVYSPHSFFFQERAGLGRLLALGLERLLARRTARFVLVSEAERLLACSALRVPPERLRVVPNGLPESWAAGLLPRELVRARWGAEADAKVAVVPARLCRQKGHDWLFRALSQLGSVADRLQVRLLGEGPERNRLRRLAAELGIDSLLHWDGYVMDAGHLLAGADLVILPSRHEGLPYVLLEALAAETALMVSDIPGNIPCEGMRQLATTVPLDDEAALAEALRRFLVGDCRRSSGGDAFVREHLSLKRQVAGLVECYRELTGSRG